MRKLLILTILAMSTGCNENPVENSQWDDPKWYVKMMCQNKSDSSIVYYRGVANRCENFR